ncbi:MAG: helix-turn-helix domain-containing protein [Nitrospirota bacterium]|nr:helix-turn-helix domain-containing protein [Nitrospirota bacterium]
MNYNEQRSFAQHTIDAYRSASSTSVNTEMAEGSFGPMLRSLRNSKGYRLREFAKMVGISAAYLSQIERGEARPPREERVRTIARALGEDPDTLMAHSGRVSSVLSNAMERAPEEVSRLIQSTLGLDRENIVELTRIAREMARKIR